MGSEPCEEPRDGPNGGSVNESKFVGRKNSKKPRKLKKHEIEGVLVPRLLFLCQKPLSC